MENYTACHGRGHHLLRPRHQGRCPACTCKSSVLWAFHLGCFYDTNEGMQLCYTRGTPIPLSLTLSSTDDQALALLSASTAPVVQLLCTVEYQPLSQQTWACDRKGKSRADAHVDTPLDPAVTTLSSNGVSDVHGTEKDGMLRMTRVVQSAVWWVCPHDRQDNGRRTLRGELHVSPQLKPALAVPDFRLCVRRRLVTVAYLEADVMCPVLRCSPSLPRAGIRPLRSAIGDR
jgi:hypothetical protein